MVKYGEHRMVKAIWQAGSILLMAVVLALGVNQLRPGRLPLVADWSTEARLQLSDGETLAVSPEEAEALFFSQTAVILDARSPDLFAEGHIQGALNLPPEELEKGLDTFLAEIPPESMIITYCDGETCNLSKELALALLERGYRNARVLVNGWTVWQERGLPTEIGSPFREQN